MKFSYTLIKKLVPGIKSKRELLGALTMHSFEAEDATGNTFEVSLPPNRYSDSASHWDLAREIAAVLGLKKVNIPSRSVPLRESDFAKLQVRVLDKKSTLRYSAQCFENVKIAESPLWMQGILQDCGLRPINNVVDIMNYVMLETGQPLHAFDYDKIEGKGKGTRALIVRKAKKGESLLAIDKLHYKLTPEMTVIADTRRALAIAGVKGGAGSEVSGKTKRIIIESANFDPVSIHHTSRVLNLRTDASERFSHGLSPHHVSIGLERAAELIHELTGGHAAEHIDLMPRSSPRKVLEVPQDLFARILGIEIDKKQIGEILSRLGFGIREANRKNGKVFELVVPPLRNDITLPEDVVEEVARIYGFEEVKPIPPIFSVYAPEKNLLLNLKDAAKNIFVGAGFDEVYNYSMVSSSDIHEGKGVELQNPISQEFSHLRNSLQPSILKNLEHNRKFFETVRVFEIGQVFSSGIEKLKKGSVSEATVLALGISGVPKSFFVLKGAIENSFLALGFSSVNFREIPKNPSKNKLGIYVEEKLVGNIVQEEEKISVAELDLLKLSVVSRQFSVKNFASIPKFPGVSRDISFLVSRDKKIGLLLEAVNNVNKKIIRSVDLVDEYRGDKWPGLQSLTIRIAFRADDRTLTSNEVDKEIKKISELLRKKFKAEIR